MRACKEKTRNDVVIGVWRSTVEIKAKNPAVGQQKKVERVLISFSFFLRIHFHINFFFVRPAFPRVITSFILMQREHLGQPNELIKILAHFSRALKE
jgi:hypothetical protein